MAETPLEMPLTGGVEPRDTTVAPHLGQWPAFLLRFRRHRLATIGAWILLIMIAIAIVGPFVAPSYPEYTEIESNTALQLRLAHQALTPPRLSWYFLFGTDQVDYPELTYVLDALRATLAVGGLGAILATLIGMVIGGIAGFFGGVVDAVLMRVVDAILAIPFIMLLILLGRYLPAGGPGGGIVLSIVLFGMAGWVGIARLVRSYALGARERDYVLAARGLGVSDLGIIARYLLPNSLDVIVVATTLNVAVYIVTLACLGFLGGGVGDIGLVPAAGLLTFQWWLFVFPAVPLLLIVLSVNFLGDGLRDALDVTSSGALLSYAPPAGPLSRLGAAIATASRQALRPVGSSIAAGRERIAGALPKARPEQTASTRSFSRAVALGPIALVGIAVAIVTLLIHSPLAYAPNYASPVVYGPTCCDNEFSAVPSGRGWAVLALDGQSRPVYQVIGKGRADRSQVLGPTQTFIDLGMDKRGATGLAVWTAGPGSVGNVLRAAYVGSRPSKPFRLLRFGAVEHPDVVAAPGRFAVVFDGYRTNQNTTDLYLLTVRRGRQPSVVRIVRSGNYALYPRAVVDGSGALDVIWLQRFDGVSGYWHIRFQRFSLAGKSLAPGRTLGTVALLAEGANGPTGNVVPNRWAIDLKRAPDGTVWAAWEIGVDVTGGGSGVGGMNGIPNSLHIAQWSRTGKLLVPPRMVDDAVDPADQTVAVAPLRQGGFVYFVQPGPVEAYLQSMRFDRTGRVIRNERATYDPGGDVAKPVAALRAGRPTLLWEKVRNYGTTRFAGTAWRPHAPPDLLTSLGLNIGPLGLNILLLLAGALGGGLLLTLVNVFLLAPLIPVGWLVQRFAPGRWRLPLYAAALAALLVAAFAVSSPLSGLTVIIPSLGSPDAWIAVAGAIFVAVWVARTLVQHQDTAIRYSLIALSALYFIAVMGAVVFIQTELARV